MSNLIYKALFHCPFDPMDGSSNEGCLLFANRSLVLMNMKQYDPCAREIRLAIDAGYPDSGREKLMKRLHACRKEMQQQQQEDHLSPSRVTHDASLNTDEEKEEEKSAKKEKETQVMVNKDMSNGDSGGNVIPHDDEPQFMSSKLEIRSDSCSGGGREVCALGEIDCGEILLQEDPYSFVLHPNHQQDYCYNCCSRIHSVNFSTTGVMGRDNERHQYPHPSTLMIPCFSCNQVAFCSIKCRRDAWIAFHSKECSFLHLLQQMDQQMFSPLITLKVCLMNGMDELLLNPGGILEQGEGHGDDGREETGNSSNEKENDESKVKCRSNEADDSSDGSLRNSKDLTKIKCHMRSGYRDFDSLIHHPEHADENVLHVSAFILSFLLHVNGIPIPAAPADEDREETGVSIQRQQQHQQEDYTKKTCLTRDSGTIDANTGKETMRTGNKDNSSNERDSCNCCGGDGDCDTDSKRINDKPSCSSNSSKSKSLTMNQLLWMRDRISRHVRACQVNGIHMTDRQIREEVVVEGAAADAGADEDEEGNRQTAASGSTSSSRKGSSGIAASTSIVVSSRTSAGASVMRQAVALCEERIGCGIFLTLACINHSCDANAAVVLFHGARLILRSIKSISAGEEIRISYGIHYKYHRMEFRKQELKQSYFFTCSCTACESQRQPVLNALLCKRASCHAGAVIEATKKRTDADDSGDCFESDSIQDRGCDDDDRIAERDLICVKCKHRLTRQERDRYVKLSRSGSQFLAQGIHALSLSSNKDNKESMSQSEQLLLKSRSILSQILHPGNVKLAILEQYLSLCCKQLHKFVDAVQHAIHCYEATRRGMDEPVNVFNTLHRLLDCYRFLLLKMKSSNSPTASKSAKWKSLAAGVVGYLTEFESSVHVLLPSHSNEAAYYMRQVELIRQLIPPD